ncbi:hypothetical protein CWO89_20055 [Bradyrhizobium sp. Leo170]|nr:hypothetical protein CWO89_20055 [Bradyrhizobium sp. Leo170]
MAFEIRRSNEPGRSNHRLVETGLRGDSGKAQQEVNRRHSEQLPDGDSRHRGPSRFPTAEKKGCVNVEISFCNRCQRLHDVWCGIGAGHSYAPRRSIP